MPNEERTTTNEAQRGGQFPGDLRDWFAGQALMGLVYVAAGDTSRRNMTEPTAAAAYQIADAMLKTRETPKGETNASH